MLEKLKTWVQGFFGDTDSLADWASDKADDGAATEGLRHSGAHRAPKKASHERRERRPDRRKQPDLIDIDPHVAGKIEDNGPGKNVLVRNKYQREDTGTHETLTIIDDSLVDSGEEAGIDPYNTGNFDRSRNWDKRFRNR